MSDYYRCARLGPVFVASASPKRSLGYFQADNLVLYGHLCGNGSASSVAEKACSEIRIEPGRGEQSIRLPFDPTEVIDNLRLEKYAANGGNRTLGKGFVRQIYYVLRPLLPVPVRKHLQRHSLRGWNRIPFPHWPLDRTVDLLHERLLMLAMRAQGNDELPFVWFWPNGHCACASITHDIETHAGRDFCSQLMDINDSFCIKSSFQVVPESRYEVTPQFLGSIRDRGFEVNVHDLNHDGNLFQSRDQFIERVGKINRYGKEFGARGFRTAVLYRNMEWMSELDFAYDMSLPNVAHLDPQRGGCCTVMPFFAGDRLEIPVTAVQDYSLFHILSDYSTRLWKQQVEIITEAHGLACFIIHPDYVIDDRARKTYSDLLSHLAGLRA
ncbi:MAG TPA: hypothetical protein VLV18_02435, partial [Terriglobales bacterium]|nr:hypothetical protein [Terriglobales bacterium]